MTTLILLVVLSMTLPDICSGDPADIAVLNQMRLWGWNFRNMLKESGYIDSDTMQYLVAAVVPPNVNQHPLNMNILSDCPQRLPGTLNHDLHIVCGTSAVLLNKVDPAIWRRSEWRNQPRYENHLWHGEYMLLEDGVLNTLINNFRNQRPHDQHPQCEVLLYSFYIPCNYNSENQPYRCSMLISDYQRVNAGPCHITALGYSSVFAATIPNRNHIINDLTGQHISVFKVNDPVNNAETRDALQQVSNTISQTAQEIMARCLYDSPLTRCLHGHGQDHTNQLIAYFVNDLMYNVVHNFQKKYHGSLSGGVRWRDTCAKRIRAELDNILGNENHGCPHKNYNTILISTCAWKGLDFADYLGQPQGNVVNGQWTRYTGEWKDLYQETLWSTNIHCPDHRMTKASLCTSTAQPLKRGPLYRATSSLQTVRFNY